MDKNNAETEMHVTPVADVGRYAYEGVDSEVVFIPPQQRTLSPGGSGTFACFVIPSGKVFRLDRAIWYALTAQGAQDLRFQIVSGNAYKGYSGKKASPDAAPPFKDTQWIRETRTTTQQGALYNRISRTDSAGFHDNWNSENSHFYQIGKEGDIIAIYAQNQSDVYSHSFLFEIYGWFFSQRYRDKKGLVKDNV